MVFSLLRGAVGGPKISHLKIASTAATGAFEGQFESKRIRDL